MKRSLFGMLAFAICLFLFASTTESQPPGDKKGKGGPKGGGGVPYELGQVLPPQLLSELKLTADQMKELDAIKADLKAKLGKLLTEEQKKAVENYQPAGKGGKGPPGGDKGGKGKKKDAPAAAPIVEAAKVEDSIQWFGTLKGGLAEAKRTGKPILFCSAAPHCAGVSGMW